MTDKNLLDEKQIRLVIKKYEEKRKKILKLIKKIIKEKYL